MIITTTKKTFTIIITLIIEIGILIVVVLVAAMLMRMKMMTILNNDNYDCMCNINNINCRYKNFTIFKILVYKWFYVTNICKVFFMAL